MPEDRAMPLLAIVGILLIAGLLLWGVNAAPKIDADMKQLIKIIVIIVVGLWLISLFFGVGPETLNRTIGR
jgi:hypothetical protein